MNKDQNNGDISLEYGNIIRIIASKNAEINEKTFFIDYLDENKIKLINTSSLKPHVLRRDPENGRLTDESVEEIQILSRAESPSYAQQNQLIPGKWIDVHFGGDVPEIITGEITNLEEDMIEITTYPDLFQLYIDFEYKGIPEDIPIEKFVIRRKPADIKVSSLAKLDSKTVEGEVDLDFEEEEKEEDVDEEEQISLTPTDEGESIIRVSDKIRPEQKIREALNHQYIDADDIIFGNKIEYVEQVVEARESDRVYTLDTQTNDLMDELLSTIPDHKRTPGVLADIHRLIERYKELRAEFSNFDENGNPRGFIMLGQNHKPLVGKLERLNQQIKWLIPVVQNRRKIYRSNQLDNDEGEDEESEADDAVFLNTNEAIKETRDIYKNFKDRPRVGENSRYSTFLIEEETAATPILPPLNKSHILNSITEVATEFDAIVANLEDYNATSIRTTATGRKKSEEDGGSGSEIVDKTQYIIQRYGLGATMMEPKIAATGKPVYIRGAVTKNDDMYLKSIIMMPSSVVEFSRVSLPSTNIMDRASLAQDYFMMFRAFNPNSKALTIDKEILSDFNKEYDYESWEETEKKEFLSSIREFTVDESITTDKYTMYRFLQTIIPKTRLLIKLIDKHLTDKMSMYEMIRFLEPFGVYSKDITYQQYEEMRYLIAGSSNTNGKIRNYIKSLAANKELFSTIRNAHYKSSMKPATNEIDIAVNEKKALGDLFREGYNFIEFDKSVFISASARLQLISEYDYGVLYGKILEFMRMSLTIPEKFMAEIDAVYNRDPKNQYNGDSLEDMGEIERIRPQSCARRFIAKRYTSLGSLQKDNGEEIFFDTEFDHTPYDIMSNSVLKDRQKTMAPEDFKEWLEENLVVKHKVPRQTVAELSATLIQKQKPVRDGEYAILVIKPELPERLEDAEMSERERKEIEVEAAVRQKTQYYIRRKNNWVLDNELDPDNMYQFDNTNTLLCNISDKCAKNRATDACEDLSDAKSRIKELSRLGAKSELESRYKDDIAESEHMLEDEIFAHIREMRSFVDLRKILRYKSNILAYEMGKMSASTEDVIVSPHSQLLRFILGQDDFIKKQDDIIKFVGAFCRDPLDYEDQFWLYCKETNTKLIPIFAFRLADEFCYKNGKYYKEELDRICKEYGVLSDDGDAIVDKHSGYVIRKIDFVAEEGYDEAGFKVVTNDIMEKDIAIKVKEALVKKKDRVFENETTQQIYNILLTICENLGVELVDTIENFVLRTVVRWIEQGNDIMTAEKYEAFSKKIFETKQKRIDTYKNYRNQLTILFTAAAAFVVIQSLTPSVRPTAAPPAGCVRSFSGYPFDGVEDLTGIEFIACIVNKSKSTIEPWSAIKKMPQQIIAKSIKDMIETKIVILPEVVEMFFVKREYLVLHPEEIIPEGLRLDKWRHFMPPIVKIGVASGLHSVSEEVKADLLRLMRSGNAEQHELLNRFKSSIVKHGFAVVEMIHDIVAKKDAILRSASNVPFLQNACCADRRGKTPMEYFVEEDPVILNVLKKAHKMSKIVSNTASITRPAFFYHAPNTQIIRPAMPTGHLDDNIYAAYIHYFRLDKDFPIPDDLLIISREKPAGYNPKNSLDEKIKFLKENGKRISLSGFEQILKIVASRNVVNSIAITEGYTVVSPMASLLEYLGEKQTDDLSPIFAPPLIQRLNAVIESYDPLKMTSDMTELEYDLKNYLGTSNNKMYKVISKFLNSFGGLSQAKMNKILAFMSEIDQWAINTDQVNTKLYYEEGLYTMTQFLKTSIANMGRLYPNLIINRAELDTTAPVHWGLSKNHMLDVSRFVGDYYKELAGFKGDQLLAELLETVTRKIADLFIFIQAIPVLTPITQDDRTFHNLFDKETVGLMLKYAWFTVIYECIVETDEIEIIRKSVQQGKADRRAKLAEPTENDFMAESVDLDEDTDIQDVDISLGDRKTIKKRTGEMLVAFLAIEQANKDAVDLPYKEIERKMGRSKMEEKRLITDFFKDMDTDERKMKNIEKQYKLGRWNVGLQKGLVNYDSKTYDFEREDLLNRIMNPTANADIEVLGMERDIYGLEQDADADIEAEYDEEENGIGHLGEDYDDGDYYGENGDDDFADT